MSLKGKIDGAKSWYQSKTIIGVVLAFIPTIVQLINPEWTLDVSGVVEEGFTGAELVAETADQIWVTATEVFGTLLAIWGRLKAKVQIG